LTYSPPDQPFRKKGTNTEYPRHSVDQHIEITRECIFQLCKTEKFGHERHGVGSALALDADFQPVQVGLIADIRDFFDFSCADEFGDFIDDRFRRGGIRNLDDLDQIVFFIDLILGAYADGTSSRFIYLTHRFIVVKDQSSARKVRSRHDVQKIGRRVFHICDSRQANLSEIERADI